MNESTEQARERARTAPDHTGRPAPVKAKATLPPHLPSVQTLYREARQNYRVLFGEPVHTRRVARAPGFTVTVLSFPPGARFALDLWTCNRYGTIRWRCFVCEAIGPGGQGDRVPLVAPAAKVLLHTQGAAQS